MGCSDNALDEGGTKTFFSLDTRYMQYIGKHAEASRTCGKECKECKMIAKRVRNHVDKKK